MGYLTPRVCRAALVGVFLVVLQVFSATAQEDAANRAALLPDEVVRERANRLIAQMTPEEKAGQLSQHFYIPPSASPGQVTLAGGPGAMLMSIDSTQIKSGDIGALLMLTDAGEINRLQAVAVGQSRLKIPLLFGFDVIHGLHTIFPVPLGMAASWDPKMVEDVQSAAAAEARAVGLHWAFAPMVDIARDPRWGRIVEGAGEDPYLGAAMAAAQVRGFQGPYIGSPGHIIAGPKHFAGYGAALGGRDYDEVDLSESQLWNVYLPPFKAAVEAGAGNIMTAYMSLNGVPATGNAWLLTTVLRQTWGFKGFVGSDSNAVNGLVTHGLAADRQDAASRALAAGLNMELVAPVKGKSAFSELPDALRAGKISEADLDRAVRDVLVAKIRMGLFESPYVDEKKAKKVLDDPKHLELARVAAERSTVLLRNDNGLLPLDRHRIKSLAVIGPLADSERDMLGPWVFPQNSPIAITTLAGLRTMLGNSVRIDYSEGVRIPPRVFPSPFSMMEKPAPRPPLDEDAEIIRATDLARNADVTVLVLGEKWDMIGESGSRSSFDLPGRQQELLDKIVATGKPVVVVLMSGRPLDLKDTKAAAIMEIWYPGSEGGNAVANLLFGAAAPGGKLPMTWVREAAQAPNFYAQMISHDPGNADRRYWNGSSAPTYPFGFGLSYATFAYSNLHVERPRYALDEPVTVAVDVTNTGVRAGDEVTQLYIHQRYGTSARPIRELKGFQRISLKPGETRSLRFTLRPDDLRYWSSVTRGWVQDETTFDIWAGGSSTADLATSFDVRKP